MMPANCGLSRRNDGGLRPNTIQDCIWICAASTSCALTLTLYPSQLTCLEQIAYVLLFFVFKACHALMAQAAPSRTLCGLNSD